MFLISTAQNRGPCRVARSVRRQRTTRAYVPVPHISTSCYASSHGIIINDTAVNDTAVNDTAVNDTAVNDTAVNDTAVNDTAVIPLLVDFPSSVANSRSCVFRKSICAQEKVPTNLYEYALGGIRTHETGLYQARG